MRKFGFELEFSNDRVSLSREEIRSLLARKINKTVTSSENAINWTLKNDHCGYELTSPAIKATIKNMTYVKNTIITLKEICNENRPESLAEHLNPCTPSCGMHVHFEISDFTEAHIENLINIFRTFEPALLQICPPSRTDNRFVYTLNQQRNFTVNGLTNHYIALNFGRYYERKTIEVRYAATTLSGSKATNWIQLLLCLVQAAKNVESFDYQSDKTIEDLKEFIYNNITGYAWLNQRRRALVRFIDRRLVQIQTYQEQRQARREQHEQERQVQE